ncbi:MAG: glucan biosynthesis protein, partial [Rhodobacteraceae bacterium]|nr:glucan biosynthesis protein [Paracoccaceae bacterium]
MDRRALLHSALAGLFAGSLPRLIPPAAAAGEARPFDFETVIERARATAAAPHVSRRMDLAPPFAGLGYDAYRAIRFHDAERLFADNHSFRMDLLPPGFNFRDRVAVNLVADGTARPIAFSADLFDFDPDHFPGPEGLPSAGPAEDMGFSGIRIRHPINRPNVWDEVAVFQGASYFRAVARDTLFGLSARGLAIGTAGPEAEEFPVFTEFW